MFLRDVKSAKTNEFTPGVSFLKPLRGVDAGMYEAFRSHCLQDYPEFEIVFGVSLANDPAIELVKKLQAEFPQRAIKLVIADTLLGASGKVSTLVQMLPHARFDYLIVNDSDIKIAPDYLRRVMAPFADRGTGMVTCLYRGIASATLGSKLESLGIATDFAAGVLTARVLEGVKFGLGSTLAFSRESLRKIGGFEALVDYLADDYEIGNRIARLGEKVVVSEVVVDHHLPAYSFGEFFDHQLRWSRAIRDSRKLGYLGMIVTFGVPWAMLTFALGAGWWWLVSALVGRYAMAFQVGWGVLRDRQVWRDAWLLPVRDTVALMVFMASFAGHTVVWRGERFQLREGKLNRE